MTFYRPTMMHVGGNILVNIAALRKEEAVRFEERGCRCRGNLVYLRNFRPFDRLLTSNYRRLTHEAGTATDRLLEEYPRRGDWARLCFDGIGATQSIFEGT
jgi:hypothetical protein